MKITFAFYTGYARIYSGKFTALEIKSVSAFKKKVKEILSTKEARKTFGLSNGKVDMRKTKVKVSQWDSLLKQNYGWHKLSELPENFFDNSANYDYLISVL